MRFTRSHLYLSRYLEALLHMTEAGVERVVSAVVNIGYITITIVLIISQQGRLKLMLMSLLRSFLDWLYLSASFIFIYRNELLKLTHSAYSVNVSIVLV